MKTAELKVLPVASLKPAEYNPRKKLKPGDKEYEKIKASIEEFGFADPLVVNADMTIIGGHQRLTVAIDLGYTEVPCAVVDVDKTREKALNIALNKITGAWDENLLADLLKDIQDSDFDLGFTGFDPPEIETLFNKVHTKDVQEDDFDVEEELAQPVFSKLGDLWCLGPHRVICGDSTGEEVYTRLMDGQKANLVLTDPPYNVDVEETAGKIMNDNMADEDFYNFLLSAYRCMHANLADDGSIYVWHADTEGLNFRKAFKDAGFYLSGCCIWKKNSPKSDEMILTVHRWFANKSCPGNWMYARMGDLANKVTVQLGGSAEPETPAKANGLQASSLSGLSDSDVIKKVGPLCTADMKTSGILASVSMAQFILESGYGKSELAPAANNVFGMKKSLSGNTWSGSTWDGKSVYTKKTQEQNADGSYVTITADFRKYPCVEDSIADHSAYLLGAMNGSKARYAGLKGCTDYKKAVQIIKDGGYATSLTYVEKLCSIIERWNLTQYDTAGSAQTDNVV